MQLQVCLSTCCSCLVSAEYPTLPKCVLNAPSCFGSCPNLCSVKQAWRCYKRLYIWSCLKLWHMHLSFMDILHSLDKSMVVFLRKKLLKVVQVVRHTELHHGWQFCTVCNDHLEEVCPELTHIWYPSIRRDITLTHYSCFLNIQYMAFNYLYPGADFYWDLKSTLHLLQCKTVLPTEE